MADETPPQDGTAPQDAGFAPHGAQAAQDFGERATDAARSAAETMREAGRNTMESGATISMKLIDQAESNAREAFAAMRAAAAAKDVGDVMRIQSEYLRDQSGRAMSQAREIGELIAQYGKDAAATFRTGGAD
ncbi:hypothetical protein SAMN05192583_2384 [Sphingomonas gellani]|uniref:Phasin domain-containing protein n=1 Tax=Sphingomonas gellani TaxID=1166340 RepID=A0A1H8F199_9SPHN|nr:phasin family protein [Sphingomonas gellani]SEN25533.1 hypothetical protein SAMN05192583_2384 [Sphingomonas gellani]